MTRTTKFFYYLAIFIIIGFMVYCFIQAFSTQDEGMKLGYTGAIFGSISLFLFFTSGKKSMEESQKNLSAIKTELDSINIEIRQLKGLIKSNNKNR